MPIYDENAYEQCLKELFQDVLGWDYRYGLDVDRDFHSPLLDFFITYFPESRSRRCRFPG